MVITNKLSKCKNFVQPKPSSHLFTLESIFFEQSSRLHCFHFHHFSLLVCLLLVVVRLQVETGEKNQVDNRIETVVVLVVVRVSRLRCYKVN